MAQKDAPRKLLLQSEPHHPLYRAETPQTFSVTHQRWLWSSSEPHLLIREQDQAGSEQPGPHDPHSPTAHGSRGKGPSSKKRLREKAPQAIRLHHQVFDLSIVWNKQAGRRFRDQNHKEVFKSKMPYSHPHTLGGQNPYACLMSLATSRGHGCASTPTPAQALPSPHLCAEPPSSTWVTMML